MSDKDNDNDRHQDGVIKHPDVIKKEMEKEKAKIETFYQQWIHHFEDFIGYANQTFSYVRLDPIWAHKVLTVTLIDHVRLMESENSYKQYADYVHRILLEHDYEIFHNQTTQGYEEQQKKKENNVVKLVIDNKKKPKK